MSRTLLLIAGTAHVAMLLLMMSSFFFDFSWAIKRGTYHADTAIAAYFDEGISNGRFSFEDDDARRNEWVALMNMQQTTVANGGIVTPGRQFIAIVLAAITGLILLHQFFHGAHRDGNRVRTPVQKQQQPEQPG